MAKPFSGDYKAPTNRYANSGPVKSPALLSYEEQIYQLRSMGLGAEADALEKKYCKPTNDLMQIRENNEAAERWVADFNTTFRGVK